MTAPALAALIGRPVRLHVDLHRRCLSVLDPRTGRVAGHAAVAVLTDVALRVQPAGRDRVLATGVRGVHANALGTLTSASGIDGSELGGQRPPVAGWTPVRYSPVRAPHFTLAYGLERIDGAPLIVFRDGRGWLPPAAAAHTVRTTPPGGER